MFGLTNHVLRNLYFKINIYLYILLSQRVSSQVMLGYYKNPEATAEVLQDGWLRTGDVVKVYNNDDGVLQCRIIQIVINKVLQDGWISPNKK